MIPSFAASGPDPLIGRKSPPSPALIPPVELTERQLDTIQRLADGETVQEIAAARYVQPGSIYSQIAVIRTQLEAMTTEHLVALAIRRGLI